MYPRWLWPAFALPGVVWLLILFVRPVLRRRRRRLRRRRSDPAHAVPAWNPLDWNFGWCRQVLTELRRAASTGTSSSARSGTSCSSLAGCILIGYPVAYYIARHAVADEEPAADPARAALLDQLPDADAGVGQPALAGRLRGPVPVGDAHQRPALPPRPGQRSDNYLGGAELHRDHRAGLRLHPVLHPAAVRLARPDRPLHLEAARDLGASPSARSCTSRCRCRSTGFLAAPC